jgi:hypothetical protein
MKSSSRMWRTTHAFGTLLIGIVLGCVGARLGTDEGQSIVVRAVAGGGLALVGLVCLRTSFKLMGDDDENPGDAARRTKSRG